MVDLSNMIAYLVMPTMTRDTEACIVWLIYPVYQRSLAISVISKVGGFVIRKAPLICILNILRICRIYERRIRIQAK
jgi:hypothetical protein